MKVEGDDDTDDVDDDGDDIDDDGGVGVAAEVKVEGDGLIASR